MDTSEVIKVLLVHPVTQICGGHQASTLVGLSMINVNARTNCSMSGRDIKPCGGGKWGSGVIYFYFGNIPAPFFTFLAIMNSQICFDKKGVYCFSRKDRLLFRGPRPVYLICHEKELLELVERAIKCNILETKYPDLSPKELVALSATHDFGNDLVSIIDKSVLDLKQKLIDAIIHDVGPYDNETDFDIPFDNSEFPGEEWNSWESWDACDDDVKCRMVSKTIGIFEALSKRIDLPPPKEFSQAKQLLNVRFVKPHRWPLECLEECVFYRVQIDILKKKWEYLGIDFAEMVMGTMGDKWQLSGSLLEKTKEVVAAFTEEMIKHPPPPPPDTTKMPFEEFIKYMRYY